MKYIVLLFVIYSSVLFSQEQYFPAKYDRLTKKMVADTSGAFPVSFLKLEISRDTWYAAMYGYHTNCPTKFSMSKIDLNCDGLTIRNDLFDSINMDYTRAYYSFKQTGETTGKLTIKRTNKRETIKFIKSNKPYRNINEKWGE